VFLLFSLGACGLLRERYWSLIAPTIFPFPAEAVGVFYVRDVACQIVLKMGRLSVGTHMVARSTYSFPLPRRSR
jgi:hypothetical protein